MQIDWWTLALQTLNFLVLVWLLQRFLFGPVKRLVETRKAKSDAVLHAAEDKLADAGAEKRRYTDLMAAFEARKDSDLKEFQKQLDSDRNALLETARKDADAMLATAKDEIAVQRHEAVSASRADIADLAKDIASRILSGRADTADLASDLAAATGKLDELPEQERQRLLQSIGRGGAGIVVVTAAALDETRQDGIAGALRDKFGEHATVQFEVDGDLLGGMKIILPNALLDASWATYLDAASERLVQGTNAPRV